MAGQVVLTLLLTVVSALGLHFGAGLAWVLAIVIGFVLALLGYVVLVVVFDGDGELW